MLQPIEVRKVLLQKVTDASGLEELIDKGVFRADDVVGVVGKTEGNGGVNDYTRLLADRAFREVLVAKGTRSWDEVRQIPLAWSGGTDGVLSPHATIFATVPAESAPVTDEPRLSVGVAMSDQILPEEIGRTAMIEKVAAGVRKAMESAGITDPADVHYVQTKTPLLVLDTINDAKRRGHKVWTEDTLESMDLSNGTAGLGIAVALGEIEMPTDDQVMNDRSLYSSVASCSSGVELDRAQIVLAGNVRGIGGRYRVGHAIMEDALDIDGVWQAIRNAGLDGLPADCPHPRHLKGRLVNLFLKCEADPSGRVRGKRNIMLDDSDVHWHRQIKACVGGVAAAVCGDPAIFVSVSAAHQGPAGRQSGPVGPTVRFGTGEMMSQRRPSPAWASTAVGELLCGRSQDAIVLASTRVASYLSVPEPGSSTPVIALLAQDAVRLPIGVSVATGKLPGAGRTVRIGDGSIVADDQVWRPVRWWDPRPHLSAEDLFRHGSKLLEVLGEQPDSSFGLPIADALGVAVALAAGDVGAALGVIGLGPGLTPAGDDVVAGALAVLALIGRLQERTRDAIDARACTHTTALSAALLSAAGKGQVIPQAATVLTVLATGGPSVRLRSVAAELFSVGATSGHDLCAGMAGILAGSTLERTSRSTSEVTTSARSPR